MHLQYQPTQEKTMTKQIDRDTLSRKLAGANPPVLAEALPEKTFSDWHLPGAPAPAARRK